MFIKLLSFAFNAYLRECSISYWTCSLLFLVFLLLYFEKAYLRVFHTWIPNVYLVLQEVNLLNSLTKLKTYQWHTYCWTLIPNAQHFAFLRTHAYCRYSEVSNYYSSDSNHVLLLFDVAIALLSIFCDHMSFLLRFYFP